MGSKNKLKKFKENLTFNNLFQPVRTELTNNYFKFKGFWNEYFKNDYPIILELGCGKGEYTCYLAKKHPKKNFIGILDEEGPILNLDKHEKNTRLHFVGIFHQKIRSIVALWLFKAQLKIFLGL